MKTQWFVIGLSFNQLLYSANLHSQWVQCSGPEGGTVEAIVEDNGVILLGTKYGGLYRSSDAGCQWASAGSDLTSAEVTSLAVLGQNIYAGTYGCGVSVSRDGGQNWLTVGSGLSNPYIKSLLVNDNGLLAATLGGVFRSTDEGEHWASVSDGMTNPNVFCLVGDGTRIYAGTFGSGVFVSTNAGERWTSASTGITNGDIFAVAPYQNCVFAGTLGGGVFRSSNGGADWHAVNQGLGCLFVSCFVSKGDTLFAGTFDDGVFFSTNFGDSWNRPAVGLSNQNVQSLAVSGSILLAGTYLHGVFASRDGGMKWNLANSGIRNVNMSSFTRHGDTTFAGMYGAVARSTNKGKVWSKCSIGVDRMVTSICMLGSSVVVATMGGVFVSSDAGVTWVERNNGLGNTDVLTVAAQGSNLFAGTLGGGVFRSSNCGLEWSSIGLAGFNTNMIAFGGDSILAATDSGVYLTTNGNNWVLPDPRLGGMEATSIALSSTHIYAGTRDGFIVSVRRSQKPYPEARTRATVGAVSSLVVSDHYMFAATYGGGVFKSTNGGASWNEWSEGLLNLRVRAIAVQGGVILAGTDGNGIWQAALGADPFLVDENSKIYQPDRFVLEQNYPNPFNPSTNIKFQIPASPADGTNPSQVTLKVYDILGREVATLVNENLNAGSHETRFNPSDFSSGVYFYRLSVSPLARQGPITRVRDGQADEFVQTKRMVLMK